MKKFYLFIFIVASAACIITAQSRCEDVNVKALAKGKTASVEAQPKGKTLSATAQQLAKAGYVNIQDAAPSIHVSLMYARADNFTGRVLYGDLREAYLHPKAATALVKAQRRLKQLRPDLSLKVYDAARPMHIQQKMWDAVKNTSKDIYVSNPAHGGGMHNYGLAVDITLCDAKGDTLDMPSSSSLQATRSADRLCATASCCARSCATPATEPYAQSGGTSTSCREPRQRNITKP